jgi:hypothetical protein
MKITFNLLVFIIFAFFNFTNVLSENYSKEIEISSRIGFEINTESKIYFNFFTKIENFISAKLLKQNDSVIYFKIEKNFKNNTLYDTLYLTTADHSNLRKIIDNYEYIISESDIDNPFNIQWNNTLLKILQPRIRYDNIHNEIKFSHKDHSIIEGDLIWADSSFIIVGPTNTKFDWKDVTNQFKIYHYSEIEKFIKPGNKEFMGRKDIYHLNLLYLQKLSSFIETFGEAEYLQVPEFSKLIKTKQKIFNTKQSDYSINLEDIILSRQKQFILSFDVSFNSITQNLSPDVKLLGVSKYYSNGWETKTDVLTKFQFPGLQTPLPGIMIEYKLSDHLYLGAGINFLQTDFKYSSEQPSGVDSKGTTFILCIDYTKNYQNPFSFDFFSNFEISYKFGAIYGNLNNELLINTIYGNEIFTSFWNKVKYDHSIFGALLDLKFSYFITNYISIDVNLLANIIAPVKINSWQYIIDDYHKLMIEEDIINYSCAGIKFGFGVRI